MGFLLYLSSKITTYIYWLDLYKNKEIEMAKADYTPPVANLLKLGKPEFAVDPDKWIDYQKAAGIGPEDIPQLIRLATDELQDADSDNAELDEEGTNIIFYGPIHA